MLPAHIGHLAGHNLVAAFLRFAHHGKGGVLVNLEGLEGVGNEKNVHGWTVSQKKWKP